ncbi:SDR family NAD(P)-dependent oxidoreductase [Solimonas marina]|uniref:SDR family oxidoreductase n=1 Tax=Solimonas marina TaxID=2714601 RepID=A0A969WBS0_9GAMM|nr:SDR family NAD(P)-dependent oxidoreductase [Solimonas marina]NKF24257.1 SDR family oxidoreductase [Solimonas marina]
MQLHDRTILITGASSGIGRCVAERLAGERNRLIISARRDRELQAVARQVRERGGQCLALAADALDESAAAAVVARAAEHFGRIDAALLNIGEGPAYHMGKASAADIRRCMRLNYDVTVNYLAPLIAHMKEHGGGLIAHTNSLAGLLGVPMQGPYSAAKAAVHVLFDTCRTELRRERIRFVCTYPGFIATERVAGDGIPAPFEISPERCAAYIIRAMERETRDAPFPWRTAWLTRLLRLLPKPLAGRAMLGFAPADYG